MTKRYHLTFLVIFWLVGCSTHQPVRMPPTTQADFNIIPTEGVAIPEHPTIPTPSATLAPLISLTPKPSLMPLPSFTPEPTQAITAFPAPAQGFGVRQQCLNIQDATLDEMTTKGVLILEQVLSGVAGDPDNSIFMVDMESFTRREIPETQQHIFKNLNASPDRKWFFYYDLLDPTGQEQLHVRSFDGQERLVMNWDDSFGMGMWLDNQRLAFQVSTNMPGERFRSDGTVIFLNTLTGETQKLPPELPNPVDIDFPFIVYNSPLTRAVYISGDYYILLDAQNHTNLWMKQGNTPLIFFDGWSPDSSQFAMVVQNKQEAFVYKDELYLVGMDGQEIQLTHLAEAYPGASNISIQSFHWSPDGHFIAFVLALDDALHEFIGPTLAVLDMNTKDVVDYCIPAPLGGIIWSPDSRQLMIATPQDMIQYINTLYQPVPHHFDAVLIDLTKGMAGKLFDDSVPEEWMLP